MCEEHRHRGSGTRDCGGPQDSKKEETHRVNDPTRGAESRRRGIKSRSGLYCTRFSLIGFPLLLPRCSRWRLRAINESLLIRLIGHRAPRETISRGRSCKRGSIAK